MSDYGSGFYDRIREGVRSSAAVVVPMLVERFDPQSVVDVGCGEGWWARTFEQCGVEVVLGIDGEHVTPVVRESVARDLSHPFRVSPVSPSFDLALCLEVAEHLMPERAESFVEDLCALAPVVVFSAAIPGQTGAGHVNCQWPHWWADHFDRFGFHVSGALRWPIWNETGIEPWYRQNLLVAVAAEHRELYPDLFDGPAAGPLPVVHPDVWSWKQ